MTPTDDLPGEVGDHDGMRVTTSPHPGDDGVSVEIHGITGVPPAVVAARVAGAVTEALTVMGIGSNGGDVPDWLPPVQRIVDGEHGHDAALAVTVLLMDLSLAWGERDAWKRRAESMEAVVNGSP